MEFRLPQTIELTGWMLLYLYGIAHVGFALVTHYHWLIQTRLYVRRFNRHHQADWDAQKERSYRGCGPRQLKFCKRCGRNQLLFLLAWGLEWKVLKVFAFIMAWMIQSAFMLDFSKPFELRWHQLPGKSATPNCSHR